MSADQDILKANHVLTSLARKLATASQGWDSEAREALAGWESDVSLIRAGLGATFAGERMVLLASCEDRLDVALSGVHERLDRIERAIADAGKLQPKKHVDRTRKRK